MTAAALPIPDAEAIVTYNVVGSTVGPFAVPFPLPTAWQGALRCKVGSLELAPGQFLFSPDSAVAGGFPTGNVTLTTAVAATTVTLWRDVPVSRTSDFGAGPLDFDAFNAELARLTMQVQDVRLAQLLASLASIVSPAMVPVVSAPSAAVGAANLGTVQVYNVKSATYGAFGDGSTNDTVAIQAAATACRLAGGGVLYFPPGTFIIRESIIVGSNTRVMGAGMDATIIKADQVSFAGTQAGNNCYLFRNFAHTLLGVTLTDSDISFEELTLDYGTVSIFGGGAHAISMAGVSRVTVRRVRGLEGENVTAFRGCVDTLVDNCHGLNQSNAFFDHWEGGGNCHVINCTGRLTSGTINFGIMCTGSGSGGENLSTTDCLVAFCSLYGVRKATNNAVAINSNAQDADSSTFRFRSICNYVEDADIGLGVSGEGGQAVSIGDVFRDVDMLPIFIQTTDSDAPNHCRVIDPTFIDCANVVGNVAMISIAGTYHSVKGVKVINTGAVGYQRIAYFAPSSANCRVEIEEAATGSVARWLNDGATSNRVIDFDPTLAAVVHHQALRAPVAGLLSGMTLANNGADATNDIDFAAGYCADSTGAALITCSALTKRLDAAWVAGTNQGGLDTGAIGNDTYHCFAIRKDSDGSGDFLFSLSPTAPTMPTGYTYFRRIGSVRRVANALLLFTQRGDEFLLLTPINNGSTNNPGTSALLQAFSVPVGIKVDAIINIAMVDATPAAATHLLLTSPDQSDTAPSTALCSLSLGESGATIPSRAAGMYRVRTDTAGQARYRVDASTADLTVRLSTHGWIDTRGRV